MLIVLGTKRQYDFYLLCSTDSKANNALEFLSLLKTEKI